MSKYVPADQVRMPSPEGMGYDKSLFEDKHEPARAELLPLQREWWDGVQKTREELRKKRKEGTVTSEELAEARFRAAEEYHFKQQAALEEVEQEFAKARGEWEKGRDATTELLALQRARNRFDSMEPAEISKAVTEYCQNPQGRHPDETEALLAAAVRVKAPELSGMRAVMKRVDYTKPWEHGKPELRGLRNLLSAPFGVIRVLSPAFGVADAEINKLFD